MTMFLWRYLPCVSTNWHSGGGLVVFARDEARARELANEHIKARFGEYDGEYEPIPDDAKADDVRSCEGAEAVWTFPDAGCC